MSALERFQDWYLAQCDGKWEGDRGIMVGTLDGLGWWVSVDLAGIYPENVGFEEFVVEHPEGDWAHTCVVESIESAYYRRFEAFCGPKSLTEALEIFFNRAGSPEG